MGRINFFRALALCGFLFGLNAFGETELGNIWLMGDSITYGYAANYSAPGGYRSPLYTTLSARGYSFQFVGTSSENSTSVLSAEGQQWHDGWSGYTIADCTIASGKNYSGLYEKVAGWHATLVGKSQKPDIILLMIGINDLNQKYEVETAPVRLDLLLTRLYALNPDVRILVSSVLEADQNNDFRHVPPNEDLSEPIAAYNAGIASIVKTRRTAGQSIEFVNMHVGLTLDDLSDGLHPGAGGYVKMANIWADAIEANPPTFASDAVQVAENETVISANGALGTSYSLWSTTDLSSENWDSVTNGTVDSAAFTVPVSATDSACFYRFSAPW